MIYRPGSVTARPIPADAGLSIAMGLLHLLDGYLLAGEGEVDLDEVRSILAQARRGIEAHIESLEIGESLKQMSRVNEMIAVIDRASADGG